MENRAIKVLVVEDDIPLAKSIVRYLRLHKVDSCHTVDGLQATGLACEYQPNVITLDLKMENTHIKNCAYLKAKGGNRFVVYCCPVNKNVQIQPSEIQKIIWITLSRQKRPQESSIHP